MAWYKAGTCSVTNGSTTVTGAGSAWVDNVRIGSDGFVGPDGLLYEISKVVSATEIILAVAYKGATAASGRYAVAPIQGYTKELADKAAALIDQFSDAEATAASSASAAASSASAASDSATAAASSASAASASAATATSQASAAKDSATAASSSASSASSSASSAATSEKNASASASAAATSESNAKASADAAAVSASSATTTISEGKQAITDLQATSVSAVKAQEAASIQAIEADSVLAGYAKKDELSSLTAAAVTQAVTQAVADAKLAAHPVGSLYWSTQSTDPASLFGGTWERVKDRFVLAAGDSYAGGATGGEATHTLTEAEMPAHKHYADDNPTSQGRNYFVAWGSDGAKDWSGTRVTTKTWGPASGYTKEQWDEQGHDMGNQLFVYQMNRTISSTGGGAAHNNMPPYVVAYCWKRTA